MTGAAAVRTDGRYQFAAGGGSEGLGVFVLDTATDVAKAVYVKGVDPRGGKDYLGKPFSEIP